MIQRYNVLSFVLFFPGLFAQFACLIGLATAQTSLLVLAVGVGGTALVFMAFACYAMAKGRSPLWGLAGFLWLPGFLLLGLLKDRSDDRW